MKRSIVQGLGAFTPSTWAEIRQTVESNNIKEIQGELNRTAPVFYAKITSAIQVSGRARWRYGWEQVVRKADTSLFPDSMFDTLQGGRTSTPQVGQPSRYAVNLLEVANTATLAYGIAVTNGVAVVTSPTFTIRQIPLLTIVEMRLTRDRGGVLNPTFSATNPIDGDCP